MGPDPSTRTGAQAGWSEPRAQASPIQGPDLFKRSLSLPSRSQELLMTPGPEGKRGGGSPADSQGQSRVERLSGLSSPSSSSARARHWSSHESVCESPWLP